MPTTKKKPAPPVEHEPGRFRDRIKEFKRVPAAELLDNKRNWRLHPYAQRRAIFESLDQVGISDALIAYYSEREGGKLTLIDGHARREEAGQTDWPVLILDVNDEEADQLLLTLDPMTGMAMADAGPLSALLEEISAGSPALEDLLRDLRAELEAAQKDEEAEHPTPEGIGPPEMALQAFEHYDYVMFLFKDALDWSQAKSRLGLKEEGFTLRDGVTRKVGLGRILDGRKLLDVLNDAELYRDQQQAETDKK